MRVLAGRYELVRFVGRGGMGEVWEARDRTLERLVAVKLLPHQQNDAVGAALFLREARTAGALRHPGVVTVHDLGQDTADGSLFLVMELLHGRSLSSVLHEDGVPPVVTAVEWAAQAAAALAEAHDAGIVHRDLKPANLMLTTDGRLVILDFGIARFVEATHKSSKVMGTLAYMAPERFREQPGDTRSDLYALGCVLNELLTGHAPFEASGPIAMMNAHLSTPPTRPSENRLDVSAALDSLVMALLAKDPQDRPASAREVLRLLGEATTKVEAERGRHDDEARRIADLPTQAAANDIPESGDGVPQEPHRGAKAGSGSDSNGTTRNPGIARRRFVQVAVAGAAATAAGLAVPSLLSSIRMKWPLHSDKGYSDPVAAQGVVYVGRRDGVLLALDAATGSEEWSLEIGSPPGNPAVAKMVVYVPDDHGDLRAVDATTGKPLWTYVSGDGEIFSPPVPTDGMVFLYGRGGLHAVDAATGAKRWTYAASGEYSPSVANGVVHLAALDQTVHAIDAATGAKKWALTMNSTVKASPAVAHGVVYIGDWENGMHAIDAATGAEVWTSTVRDAYFDSAAVADGLVYAGGADGALRAFDASTGVQKWTYRMHARFGASMPVVVDGIVYIAGEHWLHAVDALSGVKKWTVSIDDQATFSQPLVSDSVVYADGGYDRTLHAFHAASGERL